MNTPSGYHSHQIYPMGVSGSRVFRLSEAAEVDLHQIFKARGVQLVRDAHVRSQYGADSLRLVEMEGEFHVACSFDD